MTRFLTHGLAICGTFLGLALGLMMAITNQTPSWLDQPDFAYRATMITIGVFGLIAMSILPLITEGE